VAESNAYDERVIAEFRARGGVVSELSGLSLLLLHHVGVKSGVERVTPLVYWRVAVNAVAVLASNRGAPRHPHWYYNLMANTTTTAEIGAEVWRVRARVATPDERRRLIGRMMGQSQSVAAAVDRTSREIPVVILELVARLEGIMRRL
jgi:deazaflavin-dependent oxidoreductase (nitroreductase family)